MFSRPWQRSSAMPGRCCSLSFLSWQLLHILKVQQRLVRPRLQLLQTGGRFGEAKYPSVLMLGPGMVWAP